MYVSAVQTSIAQQAENSLFSPANLVGVFRSLAVPTRRITTTGYAWH